LFWVYGAGTCFSLRAAACPVSRLPAASRNMRDSFIAGIVATATHDAKFGLAQPIDRSKKLAQLQNRSCTDTICY
jgi:hypothetical protein